MEHSKVSLPGHVCFLVPVAHSSVSPAKSASFFSI